MPLNNRLNTLKLTPLLQQPYENSQQFQKALAPKLREITMGYIRGDAPWRDIPNPTADALRESLNSGEAAIRPYEILAINPNISQPLTHDKMYLGFSDDGESILYQTALAQEPQRIPITELHKLLSQVQRQQLEQAITKKNIALLAPHLDAIYRITDQRGHTVHSNANTASLENYLNDQSRSGAWATDLSLAVLADALDVNIVLCQVSKQHRATDTVNILSEQVINNPYDREKPTIYLTGGRGHWDTLIPCPIVEDQPNRTRTAHIAKALGDGNCGYNAVALGLAHLISSRNAPKPINNLASSSVSPAPTTQSHSLTTRLTNFLKDTNTVNDAALCQHILETQRKRLAQYSHENNDPNMDHTTSRVHTPEEEMQIQMDEKLAWKIAAEEALKEAQEDPLATQKPHR